MLAPGAVPIETLVECLKLCTFLRTAGSAAAKPTVLVPVTFNSCPVLPIDNGDKLPLPSVTNTLLLPALATASATPLAK